MRVLPYYSETLVLPYDAEEINRRLNFSVFFEKSMLLPEEGPKRFFFVGQVEKYNFRIFRKITQPNNYLPLIFGRFEKTSSGSLIFLEYRLFQSTKYFLLFWSLVSLGMGLFLIFYQRLYLYAAISIILGISDYLLTKVNFQRYVERDKILLHELLTLKR